MYVYVFGLVGTELGNQSYRCNFYPWNPWVVSDGPRKKEWAHIFRGDVSPKIPLLGGYYPDEKLKDKAY